ncbi:hypothetical protein SHPE106448_10325 [Shewanella pealeana]
MEKCSFSDICYLTLFNLSVTTASFILNLLLINSVHENASYAFPLWFKHLFYIYKAK